MGFMIFPGASKQSETTVLKYYQELGQEYGFEFLGGPSEHGQFFDLSPTIEVLGCLFGLLRVSFRLVMGHKF